MLRSEDLSHFLSAIASSKIIPILCCLARRECNVGELGESVGLPQTAVATSWQVHALELVRTRREARTSFYSIADDHVIQLVDRLCDIFGDKERDNQQIAYTVIMLSGRI